MEVQVKAMRLYSCFMKLGRLAGSVERSVLFRNEKELVERKRFKVEEKENDGAKFLEKA